MGTQDQSSPPSWAQSILHQLAQNHASQNETAQRQSETARRQDERIARLEELLTQQHASKETPDKGTDTTSNPARPDNESANDEERPSVRRPRPRLPDPAMFAGTVNEWPSWRIVMENKLSVDGRAIGSPQDQFAYVFSRLEKLALKNTGTYVKLRRNDAGPQELLDHLENIYGDPNAQARAARRLHQLRQKDDQPFSKFLPQLEREFADAGALEWHDEAKRQILLGSLNRTMTDSLMNRGIPPTFMGLISRLHEISTDRDALSIHRSQRNKPARAQGNDDDMDWTPTISANVSSLRTRRSRNDDESSIRKRRARWVDRDEMDRRRQEKRCLRCGRENCWSTECPYLPAIPPNRQSDTRVAAATTTNNDRNTTGVTPKRATRTKKSKATRDIVETSASEETLSTSDDSEKE